MKKFWIVFCLMPMLTCAAYPIYEDEAASFQPEPLTRESSSEKDPTISMKSKKEPIQENCVENPSQKNSKKQGLKNRAALLDKKNSSSPANPEVHLEKKESIISKRDRDAVRRNPSANQSNSPRLKYRQNPNRPRVIYRDEQNQSKNLSKIEADADEIEEGLSVHQNEERSSQENSSAPAEKRSHDQRHFAK